jgi:hypothetical protein
MMAEKHVTGSELGELQRAIWIDQFGAARDGDRFFYQNDPLQSFIRNNYGIDSRKTLAQIIAANTDVPLASLPANVFRIPGAPNTNQLAGTTQLSGTTKALSKEGAFAYQDTYVSTQASTFTRHNSKNTTKTAVPDGLAVVGGYPGARHLRRRNLGRRIAPHTE